MKCAECGNEITDIIFTNPYGALICKHCFIVKYPQLAEKLPERIKKIIFREVEVKAGDSSNELIEQDADEPDGRELSIQLKVSVKQIKRPENYKQRVGALLYFRSYDALLKVVEKASRKYMRPDLIPVNAPEHIEVDVYNKPHEKPLKVITWSWVSNEEEYRDFIERLFEREVKDLVFVKPDKPPVKCFHIGHYRIDYFLSSAQIS